MAFFNFGGRNGMSTILKLIRSICRVYTKFSGAITTYIADSSLSSEDKTTVTNWLNAASTVCAIVETTLVITYEN